MTVYKLPGCSREDLPNGLSIALGNFDGVHRGHMELLRKAEAVWTFTSLAKVTKTRVPVITDPPEKLQIFADSGLKYAIFEDFEAVRELSAEEFVSSYISKKLMPSKIVCGFNFRFGKNGAGDAEALKRLLAAYGTECLVVPPVLEGGDVISSSAVRNCIEAGDMETAALLLGRPFFLSGTVQEGKHIGRKIGRPTVNFAFPPGHIIPRSGVYACFVYIDGRRYGAVTNVGVRPTVGDSGCVNGEAHILSFSGDAYGKQVKTEFLKRIRDEIRFPSLKELSLQINDDVSAAEKFFAANNNITVKKG